MKRKEIRLLIALLVMAITLSVAVLPSIAQEESPARTGLRPDAPLYGIRGPYPVGTMEFVIEDEERPLPLTVWYPALNPDEVDEDITYALDYPPIFSDRSVEGHAIFDAQPNTEYGPYPLVVYSHGLQGSRLLNSFFAEHLASHGFVVMAPDHFGETLSNMGEDFWAHYYYRPADMQRTITHAETLTANGGTLEGMIDTERIAVSGHSSGGWTALAAGGAREDLNGAKDWCADHGETSPDECGQIVDNVEGIAAMFGLDSIPDEPLPALYDQRVDAIVALSPDTNIFGEDGFASVSIPTMLLVGSLDSFLVPEFNAFPAYEYLGTSHKSLVVFEGGII